MYLEVTPAGGKIFRLKYRIDGKEKTLTIGNIPLFPFPNHVEPGTNRPALSLTSSLHHMLAELLF
ncbi:Arm DNA-binding domain-containing protein [Neisseria sp. P0008.S010]|uniref:Arm DNA-binding domain-containing protein n=1 Tax=Neisseria sp. P0008.S010 TaxID=3436707 RepID=UPI003F7F1EE2